MASAIAAVSKYHIPNKDSGVNVGRHLLVTTELYPDCLFPQNKELDGLKCWGQGQNGQSHCQTY